MIMAERGIPKPSVERFIVLLRLLKQIERTQQKTSITSGELEQLTGWTRNTIRKDISVLPSGVYTYSAEKSVQGYDITSLIEAIQDSISIGDDCKKCCIVGLGRLGSALLEYEGFKGGQFEVRAGFDSNINRVEILRAPFPLYSTSRMASVIRNEDITLAVLCVPHTAAQGVAVRLMECGITGIVNFTQAVLTLNADIEIENVSALDALYTIAVRQACKKK